MRTVAHAALQVLAILLVLLIPVAMLIAPIIRLQHALGGLR